VLSRTADHVYWLGRYAERAENFARTLDVQYRLSLLPQEAQSDGIGWQRMLTTLGFSNEYAERHDALEPHRVIDFLAFDRGNPSSILNCLRMARENARAVRGTLTTEVWETQNQTWLEFQRLVATDAFQRDPSSGFEWVKFRSHLSRGVTVGTMLQDESFHFLRIGSFLERADNTARLLDVRFHAVASEYFGAGASPQSQSQSQSQDSARDVEYDFYHWSAILRSVSAFEVYRKAYRNVIRPEKVAELLMLRADMPRSLAASMNEVVANLAFVANDQSNETLRRAGRLRADLQYARIDEILATGLHAYLTQFLDRVGTLGVGISRDFLVPVTA